MTEVVPSFSYITRLCSPTSIVLGRGTLHVPMRGAEMSASPQRTRIVKGVSGSFLAPVTDPLDRIAHMHVRIRHLRYVLVSVSHVHGVLGESPGLSHHRRGG